MENGGVQLIQRPRHWSSAENIISEQKSYSAGAWEGRKGEAVKQRRENSWMNISYCSHTFWVTGCLLSISVLPKFRSREKWALLVRLFVIIWNATSGDAMGVSTCDASSMTIKLLTAINALECVRWRAIMGIWFERWNHSFFPCPQIEHGVKDAVRLDCRGCHQLGFKERKAGKSSLLGVI